MKRTKERFDKVLDPYQKLEGLSGCISFPGEDLGTKFYSLGLFLQIMLPEYNIKKKYKSNGLNNK